MGNNDCWEFAGMKVQDTRTRCRGQLLDAGQAVVYSGLLKEEECLASMNIFRRPRNGFNHTLSWLNQWACSRSFGLGTRIPWDEEFLVESLSDSTIYMAFYTVSHYLHKGDMYGGDSSAVKPEQLTDAVWDFLFCDGPFPESSDISASLLNKMKQEFLYWYPFDLRVSGKDLIQNHLTFCIYNHTAIFPENHWPRGFRCNGHIMLNAEKMSKSTGNFRTLRQAIEEFSADATRFSLADAGDGMDDANFVFETANAAILRLTKELAWMEEILAAKSSLRSGPPSTYADFVFANEMNIAVKMTEKNYSEYMFREALKTGFYDLQAARDEYRLSCGIGGMNCDLLLRFMDVQTRLVAPITLYKLLKGFKKTRLDQAGLSQYLEQILRTSLQIPKTTLNKCRAVYAVLEGLRRMKSRRSEEQAVDLKLPFGRLTFLLGTPVIKRQLGLEKLGGLSADPSAVSEGPHIPSSQTKSSLLPAALLQSS
ncbi:hypothetical protein Leryth_026694 [Lithospermum erythrorhizon]|nr:hypothetical protein Leryth_026694 [Lithospermum erythrorhizon]